MTPFDHRRDDTDPPPPVPGYPSRNLPKRAGSTSRTHSVLGTWLLQWTPSSILTALSTTVGVIVLALGGPAAVERILDSGADTRAAIAASETKLLAALEAQRLLETAARDAITARLVVAESALAYQGSLVARLNDGAPHRTFPTPIDFYPPLPGNAAPHWWAATPYPLPTH